MYSMNNSLKRVFTPLSVICLALVFLYSDRISPILMERFPMDYTFFVYFLFCLLFFGMFFVYVIIPFLKILFKSEGTLIQRILLTLSIFSSGIIYLTISGFGSSVTVYTLLLAVFLNFTSKSIISNNKSFIISISSFNILLIVYVSIFLLVFNLYIYPYLISIVLAYGFIISSIFYLNKK